MAQQSTLWVNGQPTKHLSLQDRAVQYGDGFFTTILVADKQLFNWSAHWLRIQQSSQVLGIPLVDVNTLAKWIEKALTAYFSEHNVSRCVLKIEITRGEGGMGYQFPENIQPNCLFYLKPSQVDIVDGALSATDEMSIGLCKTQASIGSLAGIKSLNRLENVMARTEMAQQGFEEGIMLNAYDQVVCGTQSNIYLIKANTVYTPEISISGVRGSTRHQLNQLLQASSWELVEQDISLLDIEQADEVFFTNAVKGIQPVKRFNNIEYVCEQSQQIHQAWSNVQVNNAISALNIPEYSKNKG